MDNSFTLISTMSPKINKTNQNFTHRKVLTKLALKKNIRRSSVFDHLPPTAKNNNLILVEEYTTDTTDSSSLHSRSKIVNSTAITISDSDSSNSDNLKSRKSSANVDNSLNKNSVDCVLFASKFNAIKEWVSKVNSENEYSIKSKFVANGLHKDVFEAEAMKEKRYDFDELLKSTKETIGLQKCGESTDLSNIENINHEKDGFISTNTVTNNKNVKKTVNDNITLVVTSSNIASDNSSVGSLTDIIDNSDDSQNELHENLLNELYGDKWKNSKNTIFPQWEPRKKEKITNINKALPKTEAKPKRKYSIVHKNPYLDFERKLLDTPTTQSKTPPSWAKRIQTLCDSDSSEQSLDEVSRKLVRHPGIRLSFNDSENDEDEDNFDDSKQSLFKKFDKVAEKSDSCLFTENKLDRNVEKVDVLTDSEEENFSDFSDTIETLEDRLRKRLGLSEKTKTLPPIKNKLEDVVNKKEENKENSKNIFGSEAYGDSDKLPIKTDILTKKTTKAETKTKVVKKKQHTSVSELIVSESKTNKNSDCKSTTSKDLFKVQSDKVCKSFLASLSGSVPVSQCNPSARIFRNNFKIYRSELTAKLFKLYNEKIFDSAIPEDSPIEWSERMRGTAGYCNCRKITRRTGSIERKVRIVLASKVLDSADRLRDTLLHEMCHAATWIVNEVASGHGSCWKAWTNKARQIFPELPPVKVCHNYDISTKYTYKCTQCGYSFGRHTKSLDVTRKRCGHCYGEFEILINKTTKDGESKSVPTTPKKEATGFALFVKENYAIHKTPQLNHGQVMKLLGQKFGELKVSVRKE